MATNEKARKLGTKFTFLNDNEAKEFLKKYEKIIYLESKKRTQLPGITREDLEQSCREKLLAGFHSFDSEISSEKTWATNVIKKTLNGIWNKAFKKKRVNRIKTKTDKEIPVRDLNIDTCIGQGDYSLEEVYKGPPDGRVAFADSPSFTAEEYLEVLQALQFLKTKLSKESYELVKRELFPDLDENIEVIQTKVNILPMKEISEYEIDTVVSGMEEREIQIISQIADFFINVMGFNKEQILGRTKTLDINIH